MGIRKATDCEQNMRSDGLVGAGFAGKAERYPVAALSGAYAIGIEPNIYAFAFENLLDRRGDIFVIAGDQPIALLDNGDTTPEPPVHLSELEPDVTSADDQ